MTRCIYIAGKYTGPDYNTIDRNIAAAREAAAKFYEAGVMAFCPHQHSAHFECVTPAVPYEFWLELDLHFMQSCDAIYLLPGWEESSGARGEFKIARERGMPVFENIDSAIGFAKNGILSGLAQVQG